MLKADFHIHTIDDPSDARFIKHSARQLIDAASVQGFDVLAITLHDKVFYPLDVVSYAQKKGILLIPGAELTLDGKHVLIYNITESERKKIKTLNDLVRFKKKKHLVIAPHPFYPDSSCLGSEIFKYSKLFDAFEYCHFYPLFYNRFNKKAVRVAKELKIPLVGSGDVHWLFQLGFTYSHIDAKKDVASVLAAIKQGKVSVKTRHLPFAFFMRIIFSLLWHSTVGVAYHKHKNAVG